MVIKRNRFLLNFSSMSLVYGATYLISFATLPYLTRVLGPGRFGDFVFAQAFVSYFTLVVNWSFDISASRDIAHCRDDRSAVTNIFWKVMTTKSVVFLLCATVFGGLVILVPFFRVETALYWLVFVGILGNVFYPTWLFSGLEKLTVTAGLNATIRVAFAIGVFVLVREPSDYLLAAIALSGGQVLGGGAGFVVGLKDVDLNFPKLNVREILATLKDSGLLFLSVLSTQAYRLSNTFILGVVSGPIVAGFFNAASRLENAVENLVLYSLSGAAFPRVQAKLTRSQQEALHFLKKVAVTFGGGMLLICVGLFVSSQPLVGLLFGPHFSPTGNVLKVVAWVPLLAFLSNIFGLQILVNWRQERKYVAVVVAGFFLDVILTMFLVPQIREMGSAVGWLTTECLMAATLGFLVKKNILNKPGPDVAAAERDAS